MGCQEGNTTFYGKGGILDFCLTARKGRRRNRTRHHGLKFLTCGIICHLSHDRLCARRNCKGAALSINACLGRVPRHDAIERGCNFCASREGQLGVRAQLGPCAIFSGDDVGPFCG